MIAVLVDGEHVLEAEDRTHADDMMLVLLNTPGARQVDLMESTDDRATYKVLERWVWGHTEWEHLVKGGEVVTLP